MYGHEQAFSDCNKHVKFLKNSIWHHMDIEQTIMTIINTMNLKRTLEYGIKLPPTIIF